MSGSRLRGLHRLDVPARIAALEAAGFLSAADAEALRSGTHVLAVGAADAMIENVVGTFALPLGIAPNFRVDGRECLVPLAVEEPSVVAALSFAAGLARAGGGFTTAADDALLIGQVHVTQLPDLAAARAALDARKAALIASGNASQPRLVARGGGLRDLEFHALDLDNGEAALAIHLLVDTGDAMGANLVNTLCERLAPEIAAICGGQVVLRILSNLADRAVVVARCRFALDDLGPSREAAVRARDGIVLADRLAHADPYRAATHNKGIMNGIDPLAIATGNDWRAIEAGAHAYAARSGRYTSLTRWRVADDGGLDGRIELPLKPGTVGGTLANNPTAGLCLRLTGARSARELAALMAAVGLAQNFAALRALATTGIQAGHMRLHARSTAARTDAPVFGPLTADEASACGKVILFGEHAVVYGRHALALPIPDAVRARAEPADSAVLDIPDWGMSVPLGSSESLPARMVATIAAALGIPPAAHTVTVRTRLPRAMGLGSSAALAVAVTRALARVAGVAADDTTVDAIAFDCEKLAHGTPSGVDNALACFGRPLLFRRGAPPLRESLTLATPPPLVVACGSRGGQTLEQVAGVRARHTANPAIYERLFDDIDTLCLEGARTLVAGDYSTTGALMNCCHGLLNALGVSTPELESMVAIARSAGAAGAKLTGAGGGGSIVALCPGRESDVAAAFVAAGYRTLNLGSGAS